MLADLHPLQGLVHLHVVQPALGLPSAPPRLLCLPRCAAVYAEQFLRAAGLSSTCSGSTDGVATSLKNSLRLVENKEGKDPMRSFNRPFIVSPPNWVEVAHLRWQNDVATCVYM